MNSNFKVYSAAVLLLAVGMLSSACVAVQEDDAIPEESIPELQERALQGYADAQFNLGFMYSNGEGVVQDDAEVVRWYRLAADQGDADAQYTLGRMYVTGRGVAQDDAEVVRWYRLAADQGLAEAQYELGHRYITGAQGVVQDYVRAHMWLNSAAAQGHEDAHGARMTIALEMTPQQIAEAQARATRCVESNYSDCD